MLSLWNGLNLEKKKLSLEKARNLNLEVMEKSPVFFPSKANLPWVECLEESSNGQPRLHSLQFVNSS